MSARQRIDPIRPAAASGDGSVQVRWKPERKVEGRLWPGAVAVLTTLPSKQTGLVAELGVKGLRTREQALDEARRIWRLLSIEGAELPSQPGV